MSATKLTCVYSSSNEKNTKRKTAFFTISGMNIFPSMLLIVTMILFSSCSKNDKQGAITPQQMTVPVVAEKVTQKDMPVQVSAVGTVEALSSVVIRPQVGGLLMTTHFKEGQDVKKGDLLFTIDPRPYQAELAKAQANLVKDIAQAKTAKELAARYENLVKKDYVTKEQYDQVRTSAEAWEASVAANRAAVQNAKLLLNYCTIRSPIDGRTGTRRVHSGNVVKENDTEMVKIHQMDPVYVNFSVPEEYLPEIRAHHADGNLQITVTNKAGKSPVSGSLSFINNEVDQNTGTITLKGTFQNSQKTLWPGEFANVILTLTTRTNVIVVPAAAVETGQEGQYVFVVKPDMTAEVRPVTVGATVAQETIIEKGVQPGEMVVTDGQLRLLPGAKVEFKTAEAAS